MKIKLLQIAAVAGLAFAAPSAHGVTILQHNFSGDSSDLDGTAVDVGSGSWVAAASFNKDGVFNNASGAGSATLAFVPSNGLVYTLDTSISGVQNSDNDWFGLGFVKGQSNQTGTNFRFLTSQVLGRAWMLFRAELGGNHASMNGTAGHVPWNTTAFDVAGIDIDLRIVLDTTGGAGTWSATWYAKEATQGSYTQVRSTATLLTEDIDSVGLAYSNNRVDGTITSFTLSDNTVIPEPSTAALLGLGALTLLHRRRQ